MEELLHYVSILRNIITNHYEKEMVFYNDGEWYSREHSRNISLKELEDWIMQITYKDSVD